LVEGSSQVKPATGTFAAKCDSRCGSCEFDEFFGYDVYFFQWSQLRRIWAAVQTEILTYRRINEHDPWISPNFDMDALLKSLETGAAISKPCRCDSFQIYYGVHGYSAVLQVKEGAIREDFSNMKPCARSSVIGFPADV